MPEQGAELSVLEGTVSSLIFQNEENGYTILRLDVGEEEMTVVGSMPGVSPGEYLTVRGQWVRHATYGVQFRADVVERRLPQGLKEIYHYLASGAVKGWARPPPACSSRSSARMPCGSWRRSRTSSPGCGGIPQAGPGHQRGLPEADGDAPPAGVPVGASAAHGAVQPPVPGLWRRGPGGGALQPLCPGGGGSSGWTSPRRTPCPSLWVWRRTTPSGWRPACCLSCPTTTGTTATPSSPAQKLVGATAQLLECQEAPLEERLEALAVRGEVDLDQVAGQEAVYLPALYEAETYIAQRMGEMSRAELLPPEGLDRLLKQIQRAQGITYAPPAAPGGATGGQRQVMLLTGGPGTGKTTCLRGCWPCLRPWGWRPPWPPPPAGRPSGWGAVLHRGLHHPPPAGDRLRPPHRPAGVHPR